MSIKISGGAIFRLKVTLRGIDPQVWRRFLVPADITLQRLHETLQAVMGWADSHLHQFESNGVFYGISDPGIGVHRVNESQTTIDQLLRHPKDHITYEYDFGDGWEHDVVLERVLPLKSDGIIPFIETGQRACPPEDVGGIPGYTSFLEILADPKHPAHQEMLEWVGGYFDPEAFDVDKANQALHGN